ncbi:MAG: hypothetical protein ABRQ38_22695 [Candidatus Eremiobacterota bacterium]
MSKIKEIIVTGLEGKLKRFETIIKYSLSGKTKFEYIKIDRALIERNLPASSRCRYLSPEIPSIVKIILLPHQKPVMKIFYLS